MRVLGEGFYEDCEGGLIPILRLDSSSRPTTAVLAHKPFLHQYVTPYKQYLKKKKKKRATIYMINKTTTVQNCSNAAQANSSPLFSNPLAPNICYYQASCTAESLHSIPNRPVNNDFHCNTDILKAQYMRINLPNTYSHWKKMNLTGHIYCLNTK